MSGFAKLLMCPKWTYEDCIKYAIFTDCSAPRNLQPSRHFRKVYPGGDNYGKDDLDNSDHGEEGSGWPYPDDDSFVPPDKDSFVPPEDSSFQSPKDMDQTPPLHESTRIGDPPEDSSFQPPKNMDQTPPLHESTRIGDLNDSSSLNLHLSDDTPAPAKWKRPRFWQRANRSRKTSCRENSDTGTPSSSAASSRRPSRSRSESNRKRQKSDSVQESSIFRKFSS